MEESVDLHEEAGKENEQTLANLSLAEEATSKHEVEIETLLQEQKWKNTQDKTKSDLNALEKFCESLKESRAIENIPADELDLLLSKFFISVRNQNGTKYEPSTKTRLLQPNSVTQTRRRFLISPLERPVLDDFSEGDVQPNFVAQLSGHKNLKSLDSYHSAFLKRQREMSLSPCIYLMAFVGAVSEQQPSSKRWHHWGAANWEKPDSGLVLWSKLTGLTLIRPVLLSIHFRIPQSFNAFIIGMDNLRWHDTRMSKKKLRELCRSLRSA